MNYWQNRGIEVGSRMVYRDPAWLPGTPSLYGQAGTLGDGTPIIRYSRQLAGGHIVKGWGNPFEDAWQPVNAQERMFGS